MGTMDAFGRFTKDDAQIPALWHEDGPYLATVTWVAGSWGYTVFRDGVALSGYRSWQQDAPRACDLALRAIETLKQCPAPEAT